MDLTYTIFYGETHFVFEIANQEFTSHVLKHGDWWGSWSKLVTSPPRGLAPLRNIAASYLTSLPLVVSVESIDAKKEEWEAVKERMDMIEDVFRGEDYDLKHLFIDVGFMKCSNHQGTKVFRTDRLEGGRFFRGLSSDPLRLILQRTALGPSAAGSRTCAKSEMLIRPLRCLRGLREVQVTGAICEEDVSSFRHAVMQPSKRRSQEEVIVGSAVRQRMG